MSAAGWLQFALFGVLLAISTPLLAIYMYRVYFTDKAPGDRVFLPVERLIYRLIGVDPEGEQRWRGYASRRRGSDPPHHGPEPARPRL